MSDELRPEPTGEMPSAEGDAAPVRPQRLWRTYAPLLKHWAIFLGILGLMVAINEWKVDFVNLHGNKLGVSIGDITVRAAGDGYIL